MTQWLQLCDLLVRLFKIECRPIMGNHQKGDLFSNREGTQHLPLDSQVGVPRDPHADLVLCVQAGHRFEGPVYATHVCLRGVSRLERLCRQASSCSCLFGYSPPKSSALSSLSWLPGNSADKIM